MAPNYLLRLVHLGHFGFIASFGYGAATAVLVWITTPDQFSRYVQSFIISFNCLLSGGLVLAAGFFVLDTQRSIPGLIERAFSPAALKKTAYPAHRARYLSVFESTVACANYSMIAFLIFYFCRFPFTGLANVFMMVFACLQYGVLVYVGRKIYFIAHMLNSVGRIRLRKSILQNRDITQIASYVNITSTLTVAAVYVNAVGYYHGPFAYDTLLGPSVKVMLLFFAVAVAPVVIIFNFYPRVVLRKLYEQSIEREVTALKARLNRNQLSVAEFELILIDYDRLKQSELKDRLQLTLSDVPIAVAIIVAIIGLLT